MSAVWKNIFTTYRSSHIRKPLANLICSATTHASSHFGECYLAWHIHAFSPNHVRRNPCTPHTSSCEWRATASFEATLGKPVQPWITREWSGSDPAKMPTQQRHVWGTIFCQHLPKFLRLASTACSKNTQWSFCQATRSRRTRRLADFDNMTMSHCGMPRLFHFTWYGKDAPCSSILSSDLNSLLLSKTILQK